MKIEHLRRKIGVVVLVLFFLLAILFTKLSLRNYKNSLTVVPVVQVTEMSLAHNIESEATIEHKKDGTLEAVWNFHGSVNFSPGTTIALIKKVEWEKGNAINGRLVMHYEVLSSIESEVTNIIYAEDEGEKKSRLIAKFPSDLLDSKGETVSDSFTDEYSYIATTSIHGVKYPCVLPTSCVIKEELDDDNGYIYVIKETEKVWGIEYSLKKIEVKIKDENEEYVAISNYPGEYIVSNANYAKVLGYYDGLLVKMKTE